jgi:alkylation response protein AidB-like acyl-CoA dehydrogenase
MKIELTPKQQQAREAFRAFAELEIVPHADQYDEAEQIPSDLIEKLARQGYLGAVLPEQSGGMGLDMITCGLLNEEVGRACSSVRSLLTVHGMVSLVLQRWGSPEQKEVWLSQLASGARIAAFGLTETNVGSDAKSVETTATPSGNSYLLNGQKKWITFGQIADVFLIFAQSEGKPTAFLVEKKTPGLVIKPIRGMLGVRASMLAELHLEDCCIPRSNLVGQVNFGFSHVAATALDYGRYSVAWGCVGIGQACVEACLRYTNIRRQFGAYLGEHQLVQQMLTEMITNVKAARLLCYQAGYLKDVRDPKAITETSIAKYFASRTAFKAANDAVQIHGANGCSSEYKVQRYLRDAKIMEIIEGSTQMQQINIARYISQEETTWQ